MAARRSSLPLHRATSASAARELLDAGADPNAVDDEGHSCLMTAVFNGHDEVVPVLLAARADVNAVPQGQYTALHLAARFGSTDVVSSLLEHKANVVAKDKVDTRTSPCTVR